MLHTIFGFMVSAYNIFLQLQLAFVFVQPRYDSKLDHPSKYGVGFVNGNPLSYCSLASNHFSNITAVNQRF